jgi:hypothetical protein
MTDPTSPSEQAGEHQILSHQIPFHSDQTLAALTERENA